MTLYFHNPGRLDPAAFELMGASAKETSNPIGRFGTGLKYAIAGVLRMGGSITIRSGPEEYHFTSEPITFRGKALSRVFCNGNPLGFTTDLGSHWEPWMLYRELACNARDEGGGVSVERPTLTGEATVIIVEGLDDAHRARAEIFCDDYAIVHELDAFNILRHGPAGPAIFYKGVRVLKLMKPSAFSYNIQSGLTLTEDRTAKQWEVEWLLAKHIGKAPVAVWRELVQAPELSFEAGFVPDAAIYLDEVRDLIVKVARKNNPAGFIRNKARALVGAAFYEGKPLTALQQRALKRALRLIEPLITGYELPPIEVSHDLSTNTLGVALKDEHKILLSPRVFDMGGRMLAGTVYEEVLHLCEGLSDESRNMQNFLLDKLIAYVELVQE